MQVQDLQDALGLVMTDEGGLASFTRPKWAHAEAFGAQRQVSVRCWQLGRVMHGSSSPGHSLLYRKQSP
jgi:hypothetical protein